MRQTIRESITPDGILRLSERKRRGEGEVLESFDTFSWIFCSKLKTYSQFHEKAEGELLEWGRNFVFCEPELFGPEQRKVFVGFHGMH